MVSMGENKPGTVMSPILMCNEIPWQLAFEARESYLLALLINKHETMNFNVRYALLSQIVSDRNENELPKYLFCMTTLASIR